MKLHKKLIFLMALTAVLLLIRPGAAAFKTPTSRSSLLVNHAMSASSVTGTPSLEIPATPPANLAYETATPSSDGVIYHTVLEGQFLINIAELYGVPFTELMTLNNLTADSIIYPGDILIITRVTAIPPMNTPAAEPLAAMVVPSATPQPSPTFLPQVTATTALEAERPGLFSRLFSGPAKFISLSILAFVTLAVILLVISSRRMR